MAPSSIAIGTTFLLLQLLQKKIHENKPLHYQMAADCRAGIVCQRQRGPLRQHDLNEYRRRELEQRPELGPEPSAGEWRFSVHSRRWDQRRDYFHKLGWRHNSWPGRIIGGGEQRSVERD